MNHIEKKQLQINNKNYNSNSRLSEVVETTPSYSQLDLSYSHMTTFNAGYCVPVYIAEVLPADIFKIKVDGIIRMSTPATNTMTNPIFSLNFFFVSNVSIWEKWKNFMGESPTAGYNESIDQVPYYDFSTMTTNEVVYTENDLMSYLGFPEYVSLPNASNYNNFPSINILPVLAYGKIWNDWYRDQNLDDEIDIQVNTETNNVDFSAYNSTDLFNKTIKYGKGLAPAAKLPDYFTVCLPYQQKGNSVSIDSLPLNNLVVNGLITNDPDKTLLFSPKWFQQNGNLNQEGYLKVSSSGSTGNVNNNPSGSYQAANLSLKLQNGVISYNGDVASVYTINDLRNAITLQHYLELDARYGTRYNEYLFAHWGVNVDPLDVNKSLMIGGYEDSLKISQVAQTSSSTSNSPLGSLGGILQNYFDIPNSFDYAATQHGFILGILVVRSPIFYSQGLPKFLTRSGKFDYFDPLLNNISDQPVYNYELFYNGSANDNINNENFGWNEAWADYRYVINKSSGFLSSNSPQSLKNLYLYGENYNNVPALNKNWIHYNPNIINNTLFEVSDQTVEFFNQFLININFNVKVDRRIKLHAIPGVQRV